MITFPLIPLDNKLTCGPAALFQINQYFNLGLTPEQLLEQLQISEKEDINVVAITKFLLKKEIKCKMIIKRSALGESSISDNIKQLFEKNISASKKKYLTQLNELIEQNAIKEANKFTQETLNEIIDKDNIIIAILHAPTFSNNQFKGQHIAIIIDKDKTNYYFPGKKIFGKPKEIVIEAINKAKIPSIIVMKKETTNI